MPDLLSSAELDGFRSLIRDLVLPGTAHVLRGTLVPDGFGGFTQIMGTVDVGGTIYMPCRYTVSTPEERALAAGRVIVGVAWTVVFPAEWDVTESDRIHIFGANRTLAVQGVLGPKTWEIQRRVICSEERTG